MSAKVTYTISPREISRVARALARKEKHIEDQLVIAIEDTVRDVHRHFVDFCPVDRGDLKRSAHPVWPTRKNLQGFVEWGGVEAPHAAVVEYGSKAHAITPRDKQALRFKVGNQVVFTRRVWHPGTKAYRPGQKAADANRRTFVDRVTRAIHNAAKMQ